MTVHQPSENLSRLERALARSCLYGRLASLLSDPARLADPASAKDLRGLTEAAWPELLDDIDALESAAAGLQGRVRAVRQEHTSLLVKAEAPPYEGSYVPGMRLSQELADIAGFLRAFGLRPRGERPDHLATELEFLAFLTLKEALAQDGGRTDDADVCRDARGTFLRDHLGRWIGAHARSVAERARLPVYPLLVGLIRKVVERDAAFLGVRPEPLAEAQADGAEPLPGCGLAR